MEAVAMVCVLALLFPVISLTDDLHPETAVVDAASGKRNACLIAASAPHVRAASVSSGSHLAVGINPRPFTPVYWILSDFVFWSKLHNTSCLAGSCPGRSPPPLL
jgi:hypothetical protein